VLLPALPRDPVAIDELAAEDLDAPHACSTLDPTTLRRVRWPVALSEAVASGREVSSFRMMPMCLSSTILLRSLAQEDAMKLMVTLPMLFGLMLAVSVPAMAAQPEKPPCERPWQRR
jgi:hypothetical protein